MPLETRRLRVLVVDDDPAVRELVSAVVISGGYGTPMLAADGAEALAAAPNADLILLDHLLPDTAGIDLLPALRAMPGQPSVILVTAHGNEALAARALRLGADDYLIKDPSLPGLLPEVIERVRRNRALREALGAAERDLVHAERMAAIGQLNVALDHTINNPLMAAFAECELLITGGGFTIEQQSGLEAIRAALQRIRDILQRVSGLRHDQTTEYLDGVAMIDLSRRTRPMPLMLGEAVLWLPDEDLARVVSMLLRHAGFSITRATGVTELSGRTSEAGVSVVVVPGSSVPGLEPLRGFHPASDRKYTVVALVAGNGDAARAAGADHIVTLPFDPGTFVGDLLAGMRMQ